MMYNATLYLIILLVSNTTTWSKKRIAGATTPVPNRDQEGIQTNQKRKNTSIRNLKSKRKNANKYHGYRTEKYRNNFP